MVRKVILFKLIFDFIIIILSNFEWILGVDINMINFIKRSSIDR